VKKEKLEVKMVSEIQAVYSKKNEIESSKLSSSAAVSRFARKIYPVDINVREAMIAIYVNRANMVVSFAVISIGGTSGTSVDPKTLFQHALLSNASGFVIVHNHPSGQNKPSYEDKVITERLKEGAKLLDLVLLDHVILAGKDNFSFADKGLI
jgi:DNA repair protein RadC